MQYPSQTQVVDEILPEIEKLDLDDKKGKEFVQLEAFEKHLITSILRSFFKCYFDFLIFNSLNFF